MKKNKMTDDKIWEAPKETKWFDRKTWFGERLKSRRLDEKSILELSKYFAKRMYALKEEHFQKEERIDILAFDRIAKAPPWQAIPRIQYGHVISFNTNEGIFLYDVSAGEMYNINCYAHRYTTSPFFEKWTKLINKKELPVIDFDPAKGPERGHLHKYPHPLFDKSFNHLHKDGIVEMGQGIKVPFLSFVEDYIQFKKFAYSIQEEAKHFIDSRWLMVHSALNPESRHQFHGGDITRCFKVEISK